MLCQDPVEAEAAASAAALAEAADSEVADLVEVASAAVTTAIITDITTIIIIIVPFSEDGSSARDFTASAAYSAALYSSVYLYSSQA